MKHFNVKSTLTAVTLAAGLTATLSVFAADAEAAVLHNCTGTNNTYPIVVTQADGRKYSSILRPGGKLNIAASQGQGPYRMSVNVIGPDQKFRFERHDQILSLSLVNGNVFLHDGFRCPAKQKPVTQPVDGDNDSGRLCFEGKLGRICLEN